MAVEVPEGSEEWEQFQRATFRFTMEYLEELFDGTVKVMTAGVDYPRTLPYDNLKRRLYQSAYSRGGRVQIWPYGLDKVQVQFFPRSDPRTRGK